MSNRRSFFLLAAASAVILSSLMCDVLDTRESDALLEAQNMTSIALEATRFSEDLTTTAQASITPTTTSTSIPSATDTSVAPTDTPVPDEPPVFFDVDTADDVVLCASGEPVNDAAVDILSLAVFDPQALASNHNGWLVRVELGAPANDTFTTSWSASVVLAYAPAGAPAYTLIVNEIHAGETTVGTFDKMFENILPDTADRSFIGEDGYVWFQVPQDMQFMQIRSFHTPSEDLPPEEKRCDSAPDDDQFTFDLSAP